MTSLFKNANVFIDKCFYKKDFLVENGVIVSIEDSIPFLADEVFDFNGKFVFPGFVDVHVHLREPGFIIKETIESGTMAAAKGGYTCVCSMPNLNPTPDSVKNLKPQLDSIEKTAKIKVLPFGTITVGQKGEELSDIDDLALFVVGFSDDGRGVQSKELMLKAMEKVKATGSIISAHCEDNSLLFGGYIHKGEYAKAHGHKGICSESEWKPIERDIELVEKTGCPYHVCHISTKESVELIRDAKKRGVNITCETGPHYLVLDDSDLEEDGRFKMNPPLRSFEDRKALIQGIKDGTIDMIATDHAPHTAEEKSKGLAGSLMGVVGLETAFPILYTNLVKKGVITLEKLVELMSIQPAKRFNIPCGIKVGGSADFTVYDLDKEYTINPDEFLSKGKATPFKNHKVFGECVLTVYSGKTVYNKIG